MLYDLSTPQKSIWITEQFYQKTNINNITGYFNITGKINEKLLSTAINIFIQNNDILRSRISISSTGSPQQSFCNYEEEQIEIIKLKTDSELENLKETITSQQFKILQNKLYKFYIYNLNDKSGGIIFSAHHLIWDAWTMSLLINDIANIYYALLNNDEIDSSVNRPSYKEYLNKEKKYRENQKNIKDEIYWREIFSNDIFIDNLDVIDNNITANRKEFTIESEFISKLNNIDKSFFNIFISALSVYLSKINNLKNMLIGVPLLNRSNYFEKQIAGMFVNTVPFRIDINKDFTFEEFLELNRKNELKLFKHQRLSYESIYKIAKSENPNIKNLFDIVVSYQNARDNRKTSKLQYDTGWIFNKCTSSSLDIHITDLDDTGTIKIFYDYQVSKYSEDEIERIHNRILYVLKQILENKQILIRDIEIVTPKEKQNLIQLNNIVIPYNKEKSIIDLFKTQVNKHPNKIAIVFENKEITYKELDKESDKYAQMLINKNIKCDDIIGIYLPKSLELFISIIGILKVGAIYLPIDADFPINRINYMLKDSQAKVCITSKGNCENISPIVETINVEDITKSTILENNIFSNVSGSSGCYIIYTSGSTGEPKGVLTTHSNVINYTIAFQNEYNLNVNDVVLQQFSPSFDAFVEEFYPALLNGIKIVSVSKNNIYNLPSLERIINDNKITLISCAPLLLNELNQLPSLKSVKTFISGGDVLKKEYYSNLINSANIYNTYRSHRINSMLYIS